MTKSIENRGSAAKGVQPAEVPPRRFRRNPCDAGTVVHIEMRSELKQVGRQPTWPDALQHLEKFARDGGGLVVVHFACGAEQNRSIHDAKQTCAT